MIGPVFTTDLETETWFSTSFVPTTTSTFKSCTSFLCTMADILILLFSLLIFLFFFVILAYHIDSLFFAFILTLFLVVLFCDSFLLEWRGILFVSICILLTSVLNGSIWLNYELREISLFRLFTENVLIL